jgi:outer membrane protein TolC
MNMKFLSAFPLLAVFTLFFNLKAAAQDTLRIDQAIEIGLKSNFSIRIANNEARISENNNSLGNAGFLPTVTADGSLNKRVEDNKTSYSTNAIPDRNDKGAKTTVYNYGVDANWTIFDGLTMFATSDRLSLESDISEMEAQMQVEQVLADIISTYYQIAGQQKATQVLQNTVDISQERIHIAETKKDLGSGSKYDLLQARADLNADRAALIRSGTGLRQAKILVHQILGDSVQHSFSVSSKIELAEPLQLDALLDDALQQNKELSISRLNNDAAEAEIREITGEWFPQIAVSGGYGYNRTEASSGFADFSETKGFSYGVTARINLFNGFDKSRRRQNARINLKNETLKLQELRLAVTSKIRQIYSQYEDALQLIELENENLQYTRQSVDIALERFRLGTINSVELREAQQSLLSAENRLIAAQIEAKTAETELLRMSGRLLSKSK